MIAMQSIKVLPEMRLLDQLNIHLAINIYLQ